VQLLFACMHCVSMGMNIHSFLKLCLCAIKYMCTRSHLWREFTALSVAPVSFCLMEVFRLKGATVFTVVSVFLNGHIICTLYRATEKSVGFDWLHWHHLHQHIQESKKVSRCQTPVELDCCGKQSVPNARGRRAVQYSLHFLELSVTTMTPRLSSDSVRRLLTLIASIVFAFYPFHEPWRHHYEDFLAY